jgi:RimJ/RimL family protein N-acetyltransferase
MKKSDFYKLLSTKRLKLKKFDEHDAAAMSELLKYQEVASTTLRLPFPCPKKVARDMIKKYKKEAKKQKAMRWAITTKSNGQLLGGIRLVPNTDFNSAELGFWIGRPHWRNGYTLEAAKEVIDFAFEKLLLNRLEAHSMTENISSIALLEKLGFSQEGMHPELVIKWGVYKDVITFGLLKRDYKHRTAQAKTIAAPEDN